MPVSATHPGTEIKETPEILAPIMPKPTIHHGELLLARKKVLFSALCLLRTASKSSAAK